jgi:sugar (pentulose or hexulose) kinase
VCVIFIPLLFSLQSSWFPVHLLPRVVSAPAVAGGLHAAWRGIPRGIPVGVAMGDLQCSILAAQPSHTDAGTIIMVGNICGVQITICG